MPRVQAWLAVLGVVLVSMPFSGLQRTTRAGAGRPFHRRRRVRARSRTRAPAHCRPSMWYHPTWSNDRAGSAPVQILQAMLDLERVADRATNVAERVVYSVTGELIDLNV